MKKWSIIFIMIILNSCQSKTDKILGEWKVISLNYKAKYSFVKEDGETKARVMSYNDGTSRYKWDTNMKWYLSQNIEESDGHFVDATSGATNTTENISFHLIKEDTMLVKFMSYNQIVQEVWIKEKNLKTN